MGVLSLSLLGRFRAERNGQPLAGIESAKGRALLAYLAVEACRPHARSELAWLLWPDVPDSAALTNLRQTLANLRNALGDRTNAIPYLLIERDSIQLNTGSAYQLDVAEFCLLLQACQQHRHRHLARCTSCAQRFERAVSLYQGDFLAHFPSVDSEPFEQWVAAQRESLQQEVLTALERSAAYHEQRGEHKHALAYARRHVGLAPWHEAGHRKVITLLARLEQHSAALAYYRRMTELLDEELGVEPDAESRQLYERLCQGEANGPDTDDFPRHNLPTPNNRFIGREAVLGQLHALLEEPANRLVTVVGPGGIGKTRLALQAARQQRHAYQDGVYFVGLAPIRDPELVVSAIMQVLGIQEVAGELPLEGVKQYLRDKEVLLLLDNFEQVVEAGHVVAELLTVAPRLQVLVTSREALHLYGEQEFLVPPLTLPEPGRHDIEQMTQYEAVRLFIERARAVKRGFHVTTENAPAVAEICARLDGLPLAIELAAARSKLFTPQALLARLDKRLTLLTSGARNLPTRQQTLRATIDWSYSLLNRGEQVLFRWLAVFVGGGTLEAIEAVCNAERDLPDVMEGISSLVDKNLLRQEEGPAGEPRFVMLETIHEYAHERLLASGEGKSLQRQHRDYFLQMIETAEPELHSVEQGLWFERVEAEHGNLLAALQWSFQREEIEEALRFGGALGSFWHIRAHHLSEGYRWLERALAHPHPISSKVRSKALREAGWLARQRGDYLRAKEYIEERLELCRAADDREGLAEAFMHYGGIALQLEGSHERARERYEQSLALYRELGQMQGITRALNNLGEVWRSQGDYLRAQELYAESLAIRRQLGDREHLSTVLLNQGYAALHLHQYQAAAEFFHEALCLSEEIGFAQNIGLGIAGIGAVVARQAQPERAARLLGAATRIQETLGTTLDSTDRIELERIIAEAHRQAPTAFTAAWGEGRAMTVQQAITYALQEGEN